MNDVREKSDFKRLLWMFAVLLLLGTYAAADEAVEPVDPVAAVEQLQLNMNIVWITSRRLWSSLCRPGLRWSRPGLPVPERGRIIMKNLMDFSVGSIVFFFVGFGLMFRTTTDCSAPPCSG